MTNWSPNNIMRFGFAAVLFLMGLQTILAINEIKAVNDNIANIVDVANKKISLATEMREFIRLRKFTLANMLFETDIFNRDRLLMASYGYAAKYREARIKLTSMQINAEEKILHEHLSVATRLSQQLTREVFESMVNENFSANMDDARNALDSVTIMQSNVMRLLDSLVELQQSYSKNTKDNAEIALDKLFLQLTLISIIIFILSAFIVTGVTRYVSSQNTKILNTAQAKSDFLASMSHELRTPLGAVIGYGDLLCEENLLQEDIHHAASSIVKAGKHVVRLINDILDISKVEANRMEFYIQEYDLFEIMDDIQSIVILLANKKDLEFKVNLAKPLPNFIHTDVLRLKQIVINLCSNAIKFTQQGKIVVTVSYNRGNNLLNIAVTDPGIGMSAAQMKKLFQPFAQAEANTSNKYGGTGLGLYLSQHLAECMGGSISIKSKPNMGSTFTLTTEVGSRESIRLLNSSDEILQLLEKRNSHPDRDKMDISKAS